MKVPFLDLHAHHRPHLAEFEAAIRDVILSGAFAGGPYVAAFEREFAHYCRTPHAVGVGNGTDALWLALLGCGVGPGDEVITSPATFMATAEVISYCGAKPVFVDIDAQTYTLDPELIEAAITARTKAVIPVHLHGQTADMDPILAIAKKHGLFVIEDACQAHGAEYKGRRAGSMGDAGCFSFYPGKNLGAFGEAGAVVTHNDELAKKMQTLREHGQNRKYYHSMVGWNCRMDGIQAAVLQIKLKHLEQANAARRRHAAQYNDLLRDVEDVILPTEAAGSSHVYHIYALRVADRDELIRRLGEAGVATGIHYPVPVHLQEAYRHLGYREGDLPVSERVSAELISLPMFPELTESQLRTVVEEVRAALRTPVPA
ncbi:MAG: DegT/DnrJ/EryC1/StrS family aminotransferase [Verrucomicrobiales bacterium]